MSARIPLAWIFSATFLAAGLLVARGALAEISETTRWGDPSHVTLDVQFPGDGYHASWELFRCGCGDFMVRSELSFAGEVDKGESLLVGGRAVLSRGFPGAVELGSSLDAPALMMQLALRLLERAEPGGPGKVTADRDLDLVEEISPILLQSYAATGGFQAPWALHGRVWPSGETRRRFDLSFEFTVAAGAEVQRGTMRLKGEADFAEGDFPVPGDSPLQGWTLSWREAEDPAAAVAATAGTLDGLRKVIQDSKP
jgi:hypothetical protein